MATYTWPAPTASNKAFWPRQLRWRVLYNQRSTVSVLSGYTQTGSNPGPRLGLTLDMPRQSYAERLELAGFIDRLEGNKHRVLLHDMANPVPRGTTLPSGVTLAASAAQFAESVQLAACRGANALLGGSFETDANADGIADLWTRYSTGTTGTLTASLDADPAYIVHGSRSQFLRAAALAAGAGNQHGIFRTGVPVAHLAGQTVAAAVQVAGTLGTTLSIYITWQNAGGSAISGSDIFASLTANGGVQQLAGSVVCPAAAAAAYIEIRQSNGTGGIAAMYLDAARLQLASAVPGYAPAATLLSGDLIGLASGQLVRVVADAQANDVGTMAVEVRQPLRLAVSSGSAVTLTRPTAPFVLQLSGGESPAVPFDANGDGPAFSLDFVEAWL